MNKCNIKLILVVVFLMRCGRIVFIVTMIHVVGENVRRISQWQIRKSVAEINNRVWKQHPCVGAPLSVVPNPTYTCQTVKVEYYVRHRHWLRPSDYNRKHVPLPLTLRVLNWYRIADCFFLQFNGPHNFLCAIKEPILC